MSKTIRPKTKVRKNPINRKVGKKESADMVAKVQTDVTVNEKVFLIGRPPLGEYLGFITGQTVDGEKADMGMLADEWRAANDHIHEIEAKEAGWADNPVINQVPKHLEALQQAALTDPIFKRCYAIVPASIGMIDLDRLIVFQK